MAESDLKAAAGIAHRIAANIAARRGHGALLTGDCLGQVASQTLENLVCVEGLASQPVLRPLLGFDKFEVIARAQQIGSYDTSILPFQDCCTLFAPQHPVQNLPDPSDHRHCVCTPATELSSW